jgi:hypothetical protein
MINKNVINNNEWIKKYLREYIFMPFGSMMNAWAVLHQGKDISLEEFKKVAEEIFIVAKKMIDERAKETETADLKDENPDFDVN